MFRRFAALKFSKVSYSDLVDVASRRLELYQLQVGKHFFLFWKIGSIGLCLVDGAKGCVWEYQNFPSKWWSKWLQCGAGVGNEAVPRQMWFFGIYFPTQDAGLSRWVGCSGFPGFSQIRRIGAVRMKSGFAGKPPKTHKKTQLEKFRSRRCLRNVSSTWTNQPQFSKKKGDLPDLPWGWVKTWPENQRFEIWGSSWSMAWSNGTSLAFWWYLPGKRGLTNTAMVVSWKVYGIYIYTYFFGGDESFSPPKSKDFST